MPHKLRRSYRARDDQSEIWFYIAANSLSAADAQINRIDAAFRLLLEYPEAGPARLELADIRLYPVDQYNIFYRIAPDAIEIVRILHAARDISPDLLSD